MIPDRYSAEPIKAWKAQDLIINAKGARFAGAIPWTNGDVAKCARRHMSCYPSIVYPYVRNIVHDTIPAPGCRCGFYACTSPQATIVAAGPARVMLEVSLSGTVIVHESDVGDTYRAQHCHVERVWAPNCSTRDCLAPVALRLLVTDDNAYLHFFSCNDHAEAGFALRCSSRYLRFWSGPDNTGRRTIELDELAELLRVPDVRQTDGSLWGDLPPVDFSNGRFNIVFSGLDTWPGAAGWSSHPGAEHWVV